MNYATKEDLIAFENRVAELWEAGELPYLVHLSGGNEDQLIELFARINEGDWIFSTHRNHHHALLAGVEKTKLLKLIREGDSMFVFDRQRNFVTSAILAGTCCIAAGVAHALKAEGSNNRVWCFLGDGAADNGHFYEAFAFAVASDLPCTFVVEDNCRAVHKREYGDCAVIVPDDSRLDPYFYHLNYVAAYPHAGNGTTKQIVFKK
jgi:TPP-dependent pyruvate/acetoin dehydrogenase alpha subunit